MTIDIAVGNVIDKVYVSFRNYDKVLQDKSAIERFINDYNAKKKNQNEKIPQGYFDDLFKQGIAPGYFIEKMAKYGDPSEFELPLALKTETNADLSFTGLRTSVSNRVKIIVHH